MQSAAILKRYISERRRKLNTRGREAFNVWRSNNYYFLFEGIRGEGERNKNATCHHVVVVTVVDGVAESTMIRHILYKGYKRDKAIFCING